MAEESLALRLDSPFFRTTLALERDLALATLWLDGDLDHWALHPETLRLIGWRARADLVRLRALLALCAWRRDRHRESQRHLRAVLQALRRPGYDRLLLQGDPDLGGRFWALALERGMAVDLAKAALAQIGQIEPLLPLLRHQDAAVRARAGQALAATGREEALPSLTDAVAAEKDKGARRLLDLALGQLEEAPPPRLEIRLMGSFHLGRDGVLVADEAWHRPIVRRLFQYFALHRGENLSRDRILEDLWPDTAPDKAAMTFRTVFSRLRHILEPFLRPKADSRYFAVSGDVYRFDPFDRATVDVEVFEKKVRSVLQAASQQDMAPLPADFLQTLESWSLLLSELAYEEWLLRDRERLELLYIESCLYAGQTLIQRGRPVEAVSWARRAVTMAPWSEEGFQILMRAYARRGQRGLALKTFQEAREALQRELDVNQRR